MSLGAGRARFSLRPLRRVVLPGRLAISAALGKELGQGATVLLLRCHYQHATNHHHHDNDQHDAADHRASPRRVVLLRPVIVLAVHSAQTRKQERARQRAPDHCALAASGGAATLNVANYEINSEQRQRGGDTSPLFSPRSCSLLCSSQSSEHGTFLLLLLAVLLRLALLALALGGARVAHGRLGGGSGGVGSVGAA